MRNQRLAHSAFVTFLALAITPAYALDLGGLTDKINNLKNVVTETATPATSAPVATTSTAGGSGLSLANFSNKDQIGSLRQALTQSANTAVSNLSKKDGYLGNDKVRIPLPESLESTANAMRRIGLGKYSDELVTSMNRAAEAAAPEAKALLLDAIKKMSVADAKSILTGGNNAATQYFRSNTEPSLKSKFKPIINKAMQKVNIAEKFDRVSRSADKYALRDIQYEKIDDYITRKAIDGLFLAIAEKEAAIRANPMEATGDLAKKVFSAIRP